MSQFIHSLKQVILLFQSSKKPHKIGDVIEFEEKLFLVIGIENFKLYGKELTIWYTVQNLEVHDFISIPSKPTLHKLEKLSVLYQYDDKRFEHLQPGRTIPSRGKQYKIIEHLHISLNEKIIELQFLATQVVPIERKVVRAKYFDEKKKQLDINII
ncbi:LacI family transcriptional regulator [Bacillus pseudomycoides]|uniref:LacI family transcriptional regulator n=1 Tax=Bacillus pseudomycoides TaxID=64104 RepID=UPI000BEB9090|nr:LacI family transcriptional regulator [Bacillus pseudomycoides]PDY14164.1 LacI family transcriptional regulator [Bacillus pseudomycoides]